MTGQPGTTGGAEDDGPTTAPLHGHRVVEVSSFVAVPTAGLTLAQLGADVIRVDPPGGAADINRWPLSAQGTSLFWTGLNKGKRSVTIDHRTPVGRELLLALVTAPGECGGIYLDNMVGRHRLTYDDLLTRRPDAIHVHVEGRRNGAPAVDYTVNAEVGVPQMTGPEGTRGPVNHVLPAWDLLTGVTAATAVVTALVHRQRTGEGSLVDLALADIALSGVGSMGWLAEAEGAGRARPKHGNHMFGSFGVDFETSDGHRVMVVALTQRQWHALRDVTETGPVFSALEQVLDADLDSEGHRYRLRETIASVLRPWFLQRDFDTVRSMLDRAQVLWSPYLDMAQTARRARLDEESVAAEIEQPGVGPMLATGAPWRWNEHVRRPEPAPRLAEQTEQVMAEVLALSTVEIGRLREQGVLG
jgi:2-methylfumaryl-CoA isomerase